MIFNIVISQKQAHPNVSPPEKSQHFTLFYFVYVLIQMSLFSENHGILFPSIIGFLQGFAYHTIIGFAYFLGFNSGGLTFRYVRGPINLSILYKYGVFDILELNSTKKKFTVYHIWKPKTSIWAYFRLGLLLGVYVMCLFYLYQHFLNK